MGRGRVHAGLLGRSCVPGRCAGRDGSARSTGDGAQCGIGLPGLSRASCRRKLGVLPLLALKLLYSHIIKMEAPWIFGCSWCGGWPR
ncbi:hypothetical protein ISF6_2767 [Piscinibacter sakaiensis]|uniref:Uncharacterized protein n=1 Tax=Piscinibacter sakaiensis TaxID=1547922 RepID=A0A0K8P2M9_PISS1|nr:hypothetical protein ISF6_2767 [Piscinibacter sakaiensis]